MLVSSLSRLQCVAVCCSVLQCVAVCCSVLLSDVSGLSPVLPCAVSNDAREPRSRVTHDRTNHVTHMKDSCHTPTQRHTQAKWLRQLPSARMLTGSAKRYPRGHRRCHIYMINVTRMNESCHSLAHIGEMSRSTAFRPEAHVPYQMMAEGPHSSTRAGSWKFDTRPQNNGSTIQIRFDPVAQILGEHTRLANDAQVRLCLDSSWVWVAVRCSVLQRVLAC